MATAPDSISGGKTGGFELTQPCDLCASFAPVIYCIECEVKLCSACLTAHSKLKATKDHPLGDLGITSCESSVVKSGEGETGPSSCFKHSDRVLDFFCAECQELICDTCLANHRGHTVRSVNNNIELYQTICTQHIKDLLDKANNLNEQKLLIEGVFKSYDEAIDTVRKWEKELVDLVKDCSSKLTKELNDVKGNWEHLLQDKDKGLIKTMEEVEGKISQVHNVRKIKDCDLFSHELASSQKLLAEVEYFQKHTLSSLKIPKPHDILQQEPPLSFVKATIVDLMQTKTKQTLNTAATADPGSTRLCSGLNFDCLLQDFAVDIPNPDSFNGYKINKSYAKNKRIMINSINRKDIRILDLETRLLERKALNIQVWNMISINKTEYVATFKKNLYLLNQNFDVIDTMHSDKGVWYEVFRVSTDRFIALANEERLVKCTAYITTFNVIGGQLIRITQKSLDVKQEIYFMAAQEECKYIFLCRNADIYRLSIRDGKSKHMDMIPWVNTAWSICAIENNVLVGDEYGNIHLFDKSLKYLKVILSIGPNLRDIAVLNGALVVTTKDNKILFYK